LINSGAGTFTVTYLTAGFCPDTAQFVISITNGGLVSINPAGPFCLDAGQSTLSTAAGGGSWSGNGITDPNLGTFDPQVAGIGIHQIVYTVAGNCGGSDTILIDVLDQVSISLPSAYVINYGNSAMLAPSYFGSGIFSWSPADDLDCPDCAIVLANPSSTSTYCVTYSNGTCQDTACTLITVDYNCGEVVVPTAFTPNSGNENSLECVLGTCVVQMNFKIYDRWGELVFESNDQGTCWDGNHMRNGKEMSTGVYVYQIDAQLIDGTNMSAKGNITLIR
jgi:gliding motility-associated-like protein